jgi:NADH-quinone oxidoreductase subunit J
MIEWDLVAFLILSFIEIITALFVVTSKRLVRSVFWLGVSLITIGGIYILLRAEFVAIIQILVYAGAVPILILFGIMLTRKKIMED